MNRSTDFHEVRQLPHETRDEMLYRDAVYDRQVLLNEPWSRYVDRRGRESGHHEEHSKWTTETWEDYESRCVVRDAALAVYFDRQRAIEDGEAARVAERRELSKSCVGICIANEEALARHRLAEVNTLYVNFEEREAQKMHKERVEVCDDETNFRNDREVEESAARGEVEALAAADLMEIINEMERIRNAQLAELRRREEEAQRAAEAERRLADERRRQAELAEKQRREREEEQRRAERRRRDEERRQKARADREARLQRQRTDDALAPSDTISSPTMVPDKDETSREAPAIPSESLSENPSPIMPQSTTPVIQPITLHVQGLATFSALFAHLTNVIHTAWGISAYVSSVSSSQCSIVAHNGAVVSSRSRLVGTSIPSQREPLTLASRRLHDTTTGDTVASLIASRIEVIADVSEDDRIQSYVGGAKKRETLVLMPIDAPHSGRFVLGIEAATRNEITDAHIRTVAEVILGAVVPSLHAIERMESVRALCNQALEWLALTTGCDNVYVSLTSKACGITDPDAETTLRYVAASPSQQWMLGQTHKEADEEAGVGISFSILRSDNPTVPLHIPDVTKDARIRFFGTKPTSAASLLVCGIQRGAAPIGLLFADTIGGVNKPFTKSDEDIMKSTAALLGQLLSGGTVTESERRKLAIENDLGGRSADSVRFLKHVWLEVTANIGKITSNQLLELSKYHVPPPVIPVVVAATLIVALGSKPSTVEKWEEGRKRVKQSLLERIASFDPTDTTARKSVFFARARRIIRGYTAHEVYTRGSYPASCFFSWTHITILLRVVSDRLRASAEGKDDPTVDDDADVAIGEAEPEDDS